MYEVDNEAITKEIEDGTYYLAARSWYSTLFHVPIAERSYYLIIILLAIINGYFAITSFFKVFPITPQIPFITYSDDVYEDMPHIMRITTNRGEDKNIAVMKFLLKSYVTNRESYDLVRYEWRYRNIWSQSAENVFNHYKVDMDASNARSPYRLYTNVAKRDVNIISTDFDRGPEVSHAHIVFEASVVSLADNEEMSHTRWRADITYKYTDFSVDQSLEHPSMIARLFGLTGNMSDASGGERKVVPMTFVVNDYQVKELLE